MVGKNYGREKVTKILGLQEDYLRIESQYRVGQYGQISNSGHLRITWIAVEGCARGLEQFPEFFDGKKVARLENILENLVSFAERNELANPSHP